MIMIMYETQVMSVVKVTKMDLIDTHKPELRGALRDVMFITLANGETKILDLYANIDVTTCDYWEYHKTKKSKEIVLFKHWNVEDYATSEDEDTDY